MTPEDYINKIESVIKRSNNNLTSEQAMFLMDKFGVDVYIRDFKSITEYFNIMWASSGGTRKLLMSMSEHLPKDVGVIHEVSPVKYYYPNPNVCLIVSKG